MNKEKKSGVHHIAIGTKNMEVMQSFYRDTLGINQVFAEFPEVEHKPVRELTRTPRVVFKGSILSHPAGGIFVELVKMTDPVPRPIRGDFRYGDIGLSKITIKVSDLERFYKEFYDRINFCSEPKMTEVPGLGDYHFVYCRDPEGNLIEFISNASIENQIGDGGVCSAGIAITNLERSISFYQTKIGFNKIVIETHDKFSGLVDEVSGFNNTKVRSCLLADSNRDSMIELFEVIKPRGRSIPFSTVWGDFGYLQVCVNGEDINEMVNYCQKEKFELIAGPNTADDEKAPSLLYFRDPDGIILEYIFSAD